MIIINLNQTTNAHFSLRFTTPNGTYRYYTINAENCLLSCFSINSFKSSLNDNCRILILTTNNVDATVTRYNSTVLNPIPVIGKCTVVSKFGTYDIYNYIKSYAEENTDVPENSVQLSKVENTLLNLTNKYGTLNLQQIDIPDGGANNDSSVVYSATTFGAEISKSFHVASGSKFGQDGKITPSLSFDIGQGLNLINGTGYNGVPFKSGANGTISNFAKLLEMVDGDLNKDIGNPFNYPEEPEPEPPVEPEPDPPTEPTNKVIAINFNNQATKLFSSLYSNCCCCCDSDCDCDCGCCGSSNKVFSHVVFNIKCFKSLEDLKRCCRTVT